MGKTLIDAPCGLEDAREAVTILEGEAARGNPAAARYLGDFFASICANFVIAGRPPVEYYGIAAASGDVVAQFEAGSRLISLPGASDEDRQQGVAWLEAATASGNQEARLRLARFYLSKGVNGTVRNVSRGVDLLIVAAEAGDTEAAVVLARRYRLGDGVRANPEIAAEWTSKAAKRGHPLAMVELGFNYETGRGLRQNPAEAASAYVDALTADSDLPYRRNADEWPTETARALQRLLRGSRVARYLGPIDGLVGPGTRAAMGRLCGCRGGLPVSFAIRFRAGDEAN
jgi:hypothetical protein